MGLVLSRINLESLQTGRRGSQQDETLYSYSLNKNYFSNYFLMGGERFEVNDPDYLFGDNCDLNFLSCTKPYSLPYKRAQQNLLSNLNAKHKAINKVSNRVSRLSSPFNILTGRQRQVPNSRKQDAQTQTLNHSKESPKGAEPSQPLVMFVNIRKETLRLIKSSIVGNLESDLTSLTNSISVSINDQKSTGKLDRKRPSSKSSRKSANNNQQEYSSNRLSAASSRATTAATITNQVQDDNFDSAVAGSSPEKLESDISSLLSATSSTRSGYTSVKEGATHSNDSSDDDDEDFKDALNDTTNVSTKEDEDNDSEKTQQQRSLLCETKSTKENRDIKITIGPLDEPSASNSGDNTKAELVQGDENLSKHSITQNKQGLSMGPTRLNANTTDLQEGASNRVYNIEFYFDAEVDCSIRIFYFCTREITSNGITYKPLHATYKSKVYTYKKGLNQKFDQQEHTFQPYLFDEDLLIYKPLDLDGNYNSGAVFPIVIHCVALEGPIPRQSHSLVATIEKSQLDDSYSIKPLKQLIFVDGVQYILQDIYGIEHKQLLTSPSKSNNRTPKVLDRPKPNLRAKSHSLQSNLDGSNLNLSDTASVTSVDFSLGNRQNRTSSISNQQKSLTSENTFECVICMSEERDTMLLPCRHLCLCSSCAQSLRYQASSCPICRCPFKAALNLRPIQRQLNSIASPSNKSLISSSSPTVLAGLSKSQGVHHDSGVLENKKLTNTTSKTTRQISANTGTSKSDHMNTKYEHSGRRESVLASTTPLLSAPLDVVVNLDNDGCNSSVTLAKASTSYRSATSKSLGVKNLNNLDAVDCSAQGTSGQSGSLEMRSMNVQWNNVSNKGTSDNVPQS